MEVAAAAAGGAYGGLKGLSYALLIVHIGRGAGDYSPECSVRQWATADIGRLTHLRPRTAALPEPRSQLTLNSLHPERDMSQFLRPLTRMPKR